MKLLVANIGTGGDQELQASSSFEWSLPFGMPSFRIDESIENCVDVAKTKLGWTHDTKWDALCAEMVAADLIAVAREQRGNGE